MKFILSLIACFVVSVCADVRVLSLGELGSVFYTSDGAHLLDVERRSAIGEVMYKHSYVYDERGMLVSEILIGDLGEIVYEADGIVRSPFSLEVCEYDENRNLIKHTLDAITSEYAYNELNELIVDDEVPVCAYDVFGNVTSYGENRYVCDENQNLVQVITPACTINYAYDQHGTRISRTSNGKREYYIYFGSNEIAILDDDGVVQELRIPGLSPRKDVLRPIAIETKGGVYAPIHDIQGNIVRLIDISSREVFEINEIRPFGKGIPINAPTSWLFAGKNFDSEANLVYFGKRYYAPDLRAWLSQDPMKQSSNLYQYCLDNPFSYYDPDGAFAFAIPFVSMAWGAGVTITAPIWAPVAAATAAGVAIGYLGYKAYDHYREKKEEPPYSWKDLGNDPSKCPDDGFVWKGKGKPQSGKGNWVRGEKPNLEKLNPDLDHPLPIGPHWDYESPNFPDGVRIKPDDTWEYKKERN